MLEYSIIQTRGFTNVAEDGRVTGFRLLVRMPNYRGAWGSLVDGADVSVDGRTFPRESTRWTLRGRTFSLDELRRSTDVHTWEETVLRTLDLAAELDVVICPEIHSPTPIKHPVTQNYIQFIERTGTGHFKLMIDTGIFQTAVVNDGHPGFDEDEVPPFLQPLNVPMSDLAEALPYVGFIQAKFFEIDETLTDLHIPWADIMRTLRDGGYTGWLSSEYEGRREPYRGREQVRRQHALLRSLAAG